MSIKIFSKKTLKSYPYFQRLNLIDYSNNLTSTAKIQKGFINSHSYWLTPINYKNNELIIITVSTWKNFQSWIHAGHDNYLMTPNGKIHRLLTRLATEILFHPFQPFMFGQMYFPPKLAAKLNIPLIFYGENPVEYGNSTKGKPQGIKDWQHIAVNSKDDIFLAGSPIVELKEKIISVVSVIIVLP